MEPILLKILTTFILGTIIVSEIKIINKREKRKLIKQNKYQNFKVIDKAPIIKLTKTNKQSNIKDNPELEEIVKTFLSKLSIYITEEEMEIIKNNIQTLQYKKSNPLILKITNGLGYYSSKKHYISASQNKKIDIQVPVGGEHFVYNALCGTQVGRVLGIEDEKIQKGISEFELTKKRMEIKKLENGAIIINDAYNASYESMKASLEFLKNYDGARKIAVLGDMFELGEYSVELHEKVGKEVAQKNIDILICAGENSKYIIKEAEKNTKIKIYFMNNNEQIVEKLCQELRNGDVVLVKASNGMKFFEICQKL